MQSKNLIGEPFIQLGEVDSTNNYAMRQVQAQMAEHGATWFAAYQNAGKGQRGKVWHSAPGDNIVMSCVLETSFLSIDNQFILNIAVALACADFFNTYTLGDASIKWPNDIYWKDRKAGGILIENVIQGKEWKYSIAGIGININQTLFSADATNAVSLRQITGKRFDTINLAKELCKYLNDRWQQLSAGKNEQLSNEYIAHLYKAGKMVTFEKDNRKFSAIITGVNKQGELLVDTGEILPLAHGTFRWILP